MKTRCTTLFNSEYSDFSPAYYKDGIVFCSARNTDAKTKYTWDNTSYIDLFVMRDSLRAPMSLGKPVNTALHEGPATFSTNFDTIFFTRNNYINNKKSNSKDGVVKLKIYYAVLKNGIWQKEQNLPFSSDEYSIGHPALGKDHKLYFVSDMPGGIGGTDIYYTTLVNGQWSNPVNVGPECFLLLTSTGTYTLRLLVTLDSVVSMSFRLNPLVAISLLQKILAILLIHQKTTSVL